jgi:hypothetical protein
MILRYFKARRMAMPPQYVRDFADLYTTDNLRDLFYSSRDRDVVRLEEGVIPRAELRAEIQRRVWWERFGYRVLTTASVIAGVAAVIGAIAAVIAAYEGWQGLWPR